MPALRAPARPRQPELVLPAPHPGQQEILASAARYKIVRAGRRYGKDRLALLASLVGHGPSFDGKPLHQAALQGRDVLWLGPDYPQIRSIWHEEVEPRFGAHPRISLNRAERRIQIRGAGAVQFRSAVGLKSIRGVGANLGGIVVNEASYLDLEDALKNVLFPALLDVRGWLIILATPNAGPDGHETAEGKRTPSHFNMLCERVTAGEMGDDWQHWHATTRDTPVLNPAAVQELYDQYEADDPELAQELDAKLIEAGSGVAFPEWNDRVHTADYEPPQTEGVWTGGGDWGYTSPGCLYLMWSGPERSLVRLEYVYRKTDPYTVGYEWAMKVLKYPPAQWYAVDEPAVSDGGPTILERLARGYRDAWNAHGSGFGVQMPAFITPPKGPGSRAAKKMLLHEMLRYERARRTGVTPNESESHAEAPGGVPVWGMPRLQIHRDCVTLIRTLPRLPKDPKGKEDVDTNAFDHPYDGLTSWLMARVPEPERRQTKVIDPDTHEGWAEKLAGTEDASPMRVRWTREPEKW